MEKVPDMKHQDSNTAMLTAKWSVMQWMLDPKYCFPVVRAEQHSSMAQVNLVKQMNQDPGLETL